MKQILTSLPKLSLLAGALCLAQANIALAHGHGNGWGHDRDTNVYIYNDYNNGHRGPVYVKKHGHHKNVYVVRERHIPYKVMNTYPAFTTYPTVRIRCTNQPILGTVIGGLTGGLIGNQFGKGSGKVYATVGGAILGSAIGNSVAVADQRCASQALEYARPGTQVSWQNPDNGYGYTVLPTNDFQNPDGRYCREYHTVSYIGGRQQETYGTACRQPDGSWEIGN